MVRETQRDKVHIVYAVMVHEDTHIIYNTCGRSGITHPVNVASF